MNNEDLELLKLYGVIYGDIPTPTPSSQCACCSTTTTTSGPCYGCGERTWVKKDGIWNAISSCSGSPSIDGYICEDYPDPDYFYPYASNGDVVNLTCFCVVSTTTTIQPCLCATNVSNNLICFNGTLRFLDNACNAPCTMKSLSGYPEPGSSCVPTDYYSVTSRCDCENTTTSTSTTETPTTTTETPTTTSTTETPTTTSTTETPTTTTAICNGCGQSTWFKENGFWTMIEDCDGSPSVGGYTCQTTYPDPDYFYPYAQNGDTVYLTCSCF